MQVVVSFTEDVYVRRKLGHRVSLKHITLLTIFPFLRTKEISSPVPSSLLPHAEWLIVAFVVGAPATTHAFRGPPSTLKNLLRCSP